MYASQIPSRPQPYAPTPYGYVSNPSLSAKISPDEEVKVADSAAERDLLDSLAEIYSIIRTLDGLEKAFIRDAVTEVEYTETCSKLLKQHKSIISDRTVAEEYGDLDAFCRKWDIECPRAVETLRDGMPRTVKEAHQSNPVPQARDGPAASLLMTATENFITFLDALRLNMVSKDALHPLLTEVIQSVNKVTDRDFDNRGKIIQWLITLNQMRTTEELSEEQARELAFDMDNAYSGFKATIH